MVLIHLILKELRMFSYGLQQTNIYVQPLHVIN